MNLLINGITNSVRKNACFSLLNKTILKNSYYTFQISDKTSTNSHTTRPKVTNNRSLPLTYEQSKFAEEIGNKKSWNSWNTSNLFDGNRQAETTFDDLFIRKFVYATWHDILASEIIIKRRFNTINIVFLINKGRKKLLPRQVYFLSGYTEELLSVLFKCVVKVEFQSVADRYDTLFRYW